MARGETQGFRLTPELHLSVEAYSASSVGAVHVCVCTNIYIYTYMYVYVYVYIYVCITYMETERTGRRATRFLDSAFCRV